MTAPAAVSPSRSAASSLGYNLGIIVVIVVLVGIAIAYAIDAAGRAANAPPARTDADATLTRTLGGKDLAIPASWFRYAEQRVEGFAKQIDLRFGLPLGQDGAVHSVDVTLLPRSGIRPSARLLDGVYLHMFEEGELAGPHGLIGKPLRATEGYEAETVWYDPLSADPFVAKCGAAIAPGGQPRCLRAVYVAPGIAAIYAFDFELLNAWRRFDPEVRAWLDRIGVFRP
jgi:hypothetical protein